MEEVCNSRGKRLIHGEKSRSRALALNAVIAVSRVDRGRVRAHSTPSQPDPLILEWAKGKASIISCNVLQILTLPIMISRVECIGERLLYFSAQRGWSHARKSTVSNLRWTASGQQVERYTRLEKL